MPAASKKSYGPTVQARAKQLLKAILDVVGEDARDRGLRFNADWAELNPPRLTIETTLRELTLLVDPSLKANTPEFKRSKSQTGEALADLQDFVQILDDHRTQKQGSDKWHFSVRLWGKDVDRNLTEFDKLWESKRPSHQNDLHSRRQVKSLHVSIPANLPRSGVIEFVGRAEIMPQLHEILQQGERVAVSAIAGMGGIGKTELALQYALAYKQSYPGGICWLQARSGDLATQLVRFGQSCLGLHPPDGLELADQVKYCWRNWQAGEALLVFDDIVDYGAIELCLPPLTEPRFKVLMTTRLRLGASVNQLELDVLHESSALALLKSLVGDHRVQSQLDAARSLCEKLGYLPLGLELAGRYLARKADLSLAELLKRLEAQRLTAKALCQTDADMTAKLGVAAAFQLSWDALSPGAQMLGCRLSLFATAPLHWPIVEQCNINQNPEELEEQRDGELLNLHLLQRVADSTYRLHPLIREFFQSQLAHFSNADVLKQQFCQTVVAISRQISRNPVRQQIIAVAPAIPHMEEVATQLSAWLSDEDLSVPYTSLGWFYAGQGTYSQAEPWFVQCLLVTQSRLTSNHLDIAASLNNLAELYQLEGRYSEAEPLCQQSLEIRKKQLGSDHPDVAQSLNDLALLYDYQGRHSEAEPLYWQSLEMRRQQLGDDHLDVAQSLNDFALLSWNQKLYDRAENFYQESLSIRERQLGSSHPEVAQSLNNLAALYNDWGRYEEAEPLFQRALLIREQHLGIDHTYFASSLNNLAVLYTRQGRYEEAEPLFQRSLDIDKWASGDTHPRVGRCLDNLAKLHAEKHDDRVAEVLYLEALAILELGLGAEHPWTVRCQGHLNDLRNRK